MSHNWLGAEQAASKFKIAVSTVYRLGHLKRVGTKTVNGVLKYSESSLETYMKSRTSRAVSRARVTTNTAPIAETDAEGAKESFVSGREATEISGCSSDYLYKLEKANRVRTLRGDGPVRYNETDLRKIAEDRKRFQAENTENSSWLLRRHAMKKNELSSSEFTEICNTYQIRTKSSNRVGWSLYYQPDLMVATKQFRETREAKAAAPPAPAARRAPRAATNTTVTTPIPPTETTPFTPLHVVEQVMAVSKRDLPAPTVRETWEYAAWLTRSVADGYLPVDMARALTNKLS